MKNNANSQPGQALPPIPLKIGNDLFEKKFGGKPLDVCLIELIKNCRDYQGSNIKINIGTDNVEVIDDGIGMNEARRIAFCSAAITTSDMDKQSGKFGTGSKMMLYRSNGVEVMTRTADDEGTVYFNINTAQYQNQSLGGGQIQPKVLPKALWGESFPTGTKLKYDFSGPASRLLKKVDHIAKKLSQTLPIMVLDSISLNGKPLPAKQLRSQPLREEFQDDALGRVSIEVYRLKEGAKANSGLFLSSTGMPEVSFARFYSLLPMKLRLAIPDLYLNMAEMSGLITCNKLFGRYINEDRDSFVETIADEELTKHFIKLLRSKEEEIRSVLGLQSQQGDKNIQELIDDLYKRAEKAYGKTFSTTGEASPVDTVPRESSPIKIHGARLQYEPGQQVELKLVIDHDKCSVETDNIRWLTMNSGLIDIKISPDKLGLTAITGKVFGWNSLSVDAGDVSAQTHFEIVPKIRPYLSANNVTLTVGQDYKLTVHNTDQLKEKVQWRFKGAGRLEVLGKGGKQGQAVFFRTEAGEAMVYAEGYKLDGTVFQDTCEIQIRDQRVQLLMIKDCKFKIYEVDRPGNPPIMMIKGHSSDPVEDEHQLTFNSASRIWQNRETKNSLPLILGMISNEFSRFFYQDIMQEEASSNVDTLCKYSLLSEEILMELIGE